MELLLALLAATLSAVLVGPWVALAVGGRWTSHRTRRSVQLVSAMQELALPPGGGVLPGDPDVVVYRDPDDAVVVFTELPIPLTLVRGPGPFGYVPSGRVGHFTVEAAEVCRAAGAYVLGSDVRVRCADPSRLLHAVDAVRELYHLLANPTVEALAATVRASLDHPDQLRASLQLLRTLDPSAHHAVAAELLPRAPDLARVELLDAVEHYPELVELALAAAAEGRHFVAWEAASRVVTGSPHDAATLIRWAPALVHAEVCARALLRGLEVRPSAAGAAWLRHEWARDFVGWAVGARSAAAHQVAATVDDPSVLRAALGGPWPEVRRVAVRRLGEIGGIDVVPALRDGQRAGALPSDEVDVAVVAIQHRAGGVPGAVALARGGGEVSVAPLPAGGQVADAGGGEISTR